MYLVPTPKLNCWNHCTLGPAQNFSPLVGSTGGDANPNFSVDKGGRGGRGKTEFCLWQHSKRNQVEQKPQKTAQARQILTMGLFYPCLDNMQRSLVSPADPDPERTPLEPEPSLFCVNTRTILTLTLLVSSFALEKREFSSLRHHSEDKSFS